MYRNVSALGGAVVGGVFQWVRAPIPLQSAAFEIVIANVGFGSKPDYCSATWEGPLSGKAQDRDLAEKAGDGERKEARKNR